MPNQKLSNLKTKVRRYAPAMLVGLGAVSVFAAGIYAKKLGNSVDQLTEPDRLAGGRMIVLDNVDGGNLWRDMDEPDNYYRLEGVA